MINEKVVIAARKLVGQHLKNIREEKQLSYYAVGKLAGMSISKFKDLKAEKKHTHLIAF